MEYPPFDISMLRTGHFVLYKSTGDFLGKMIVKHQLETGIPKEAAQYVHVDVLGPRQWAIRVNPPKAKIVDISEHYRGREAAIVKYNADDYDDKRYKIAWWAATHNNLSYDYLGILKFKIGWMWHKKNLFFCSENAAWSLRKEYPFAFGKVGEYRVMPGHFFNKELSVVWKGVIQ